MPGKRKYQDLAHLSVEEYKIEAAKRRESERKDYKKEYYFKKQGHIRSEHKKIILEEQLAILLTKIEKLDKKFATPV
jgi:hypothetical protein